MNVGKIVTVCGKNFEYFLWNGQTMKNQLVAFDLKTTRKGSKKYPALPGGSKLAASSPQKENYGVKPEQIVCAAVSTTDEHFVVPVEVLGDFLRQHEKTTFVMHGAARQWELVESFLKDQYPDLVDAWWETVNQNRLRDTQILDQLIRLGQIDEAPVPRLFVDVVLFHTGVHLEEKNPYQDRYHEFLRMGLSKNWSTFESKFLDWTIRDALVMAFTYERMCDTAASLMDRHAAELLPNALQRFGPLTECIQVKADIVLRNITRNGLRVDLPAADALRISAENELEAIMQKIKALPNDYELFTEYKAGPQKGAIRRTANLKPMIKQETLEMLLLRAADEVYTRSGYQIQVPLTDEGLVSLSSKRWQSHSHRHEFIALWIELERVARLVNFLAGLITPIINPEYQLMVRNGRAPASKPNIQQCPRAPGYRDLFLATQGSLFLTLDYSFIELCTLAAVCERRYGKSQLADVIRRGVDPHAYTAAMFEKVSLEEFMKWKSSSDSVERKKFETLRQRAKAINFGIPGGQGAAALVEYALNSYGVDLSLDDAKSFRDRLIREIYPELSHYLFEDRRFIDTLAQRLNVHVNDVWAELKQLKTIIDEEDEERTSGQIASDVRNVIAGRHQSDGNLYPEEFKQAVWAMLKRLNRSGTLANVLETAMDEGTDDLDNKLFGIDVTTLTGRVRGGVAFTQACNTPFSGLAADGAKLALWNLMHVGFRIVAFVHDEILMEIPIGSDHQREANLASDIMCKTMSQVCQNIPIGCKFCLADRWSRDAVAVYDPLTTRLIPWQKPSQ